MKSQNKVFNKYFSLGFNSKGINSLVNPQDKYKMDFILQDDNNYVDYNDIFKELGELSILYNKNGKSFTFNSDSVCNQQEKKITITKENNDLQVN